MHKFRTQARRSAWYTQEGDDGPNYNPFCRTRLQQRHRPNDPENPRNHSATCLPDHTGSTELTDDGEGIIPGLNHARTVPMSSGANPEVSLDKDIEMTSPPTSDTNRPLAGGERPMRRRFWSRKSTIGRKSDRSPTTESAKQKLKFSFWGQIRATLFSSWINVLFIFAPAGIAVNFLGVSPVIVFVVNFIAIIPLAAMLSYATEELALRVGETLGGLLNATFGNAVELIVSILALIKREVLIVQTSLIGSILSNLLLVLGMCFFAGGLNRVEQFFNVTVAQTASSLLALSVGSLIIPTAFHAWSKAGDAGITELSRGTAIILLIVYGCYLYFQLKSHATLYNEPSRKVESKRGKPEGASKKGIAAIGRGLASGIGGQTVPAYDPDGEMLPELSIVTALLTLAISTALVALCAEFMVGSIDALSETGNISKTFIGLILLPIVGNAAEHATAVTVAIKDKMDLAIGVAVGSSMQIALLVVPLIVVLGWILGIHDMTLYFDGFQIAVLFVAVLLVNYLIQDGKSHWLEGVLLMSTYLIISIAAWFYPSEGKQ
ncbi:hypothetical protein FGG08_007078 [Glutinoglossum americanum]|uniref:Vacuolar calcium ion transporter n=1 Tax=Glutinoglossum americanum TaxID=1670608 RepID=A0A9P8KZR2_9PEZI|nr:hypothetical protein FGG08_007078 [Glutinoglossum americanum]